MENLHHGLIVALPFAIEQDIFSRITRKGYVKVIGHKPVVQGRLLAIGDIHGEADKLRRLLNLLSPDSTDQLVFLGDYIDRGKHGREVIERLLAIRVEFPQTIFLRGNHEQMLLDSLVEVGVRPGPQLSDISPFYRDSRFPSVVELFLGNGGQETLRSYRLSDLVDGFPLEHLAFIESTRLWWTYQNFIFVHAGLTPDIPIHQQDPGVMLWDRFAPPGQGAQIHVVGHQVLRDGEARFESGRYLLDTGAVHGMALTACDVLTETVWQVR